MKNVKKIFKITTANISYKTYDISADNLEDAMEIIKNNGYGYAHGYTSTIPENLINSFPEFKIFHELSSVIEPSEKNFSESFIQNIWNEDLILEINYSKTEDRELLPIIIESFKVTCESKNIEIFNFEPKKFISFFVKKIAEAKQMIVDGKLKEPFLENLIKEIVIICSYEEIKFKS